LTGLEIVLANPLKVILYAVPKELSSNTLRLSAQGLPPRLDLLGLGNKGLFFSIGRLLISILSWP